MQVLRTSTPLLQTVSRFAARDGVLSLWRGLSASVLRQSTYSTARFGLYALLSQSAQRHASPADPARPLSAAWTVACAGAAGGLAGLIGNPTEVVLVRMCADGARPEAERFGYRNGVVGIWRVAREEGVGAFGKGLSANVTRSVLMSMFLFPSCCLFRVRILSWYLTAIGLTD
jgi:solute carrier family 25 (mitochondrial dicarboxylate transporter), member 10